MRRAVLALIFSIVAMTAGFGQVPAADGDGAVAARYFEYALAAAVDGRWMEAEETLSRASDFSDVSSDVSYLLALARLKNDKPVGAALEAVVRAIEADRWRRYTAENGRLLEGECLVSIRSFDQALSVVSRCADSPDSAWVRLRAYKGQGDFTRYRAVMRDALDSYPNDTRFVRLLFVSLDPKVASDGDLALAETAVARLPFLIDSDPLLGVLAYPFIRDREERRSIIAAYRAESNLSPLSIAPALDQGLISDADATSELFANAKIDLAVLRSVFGLLRSDESRSFFSRTSAAYTGTIVEDSDMDARPESKTTYVNGFVSSFAFDADQDGIPELSVEFLDGLPKTASIAAALSPDAPADVLSDSKRLPARPIRTGELIRADIVWARFPYAESAGLNGIRYTYPPKGFPLAPLRLVRLVSAGDVRIPAADFLAFRLTDRSLLSFASSIEREGSLADGSVEHIDFVRGVAIRATETVGGRLIARTEFEKGRPAARHIDMDLDGRMETIQRFRFSPNDGAVIDRVEIDENGDGKIDHAEQY